MHCIFFVTHKFKFNLIMFYQDIMTSSFDTLARIDYFCGGH